MISYDNLIRILRPHCDKWKQTKDNVAYFGFHEYVKGEFGFEYDRGLYKVLDEKKFMWFLLKYSGTNKDE